MENEINNFEDLDNLKFYGGEKYHSHKIFQLLDDLYDFYDFLQLNISNNAKAVFCIKDMPDIDGIMFGSIKGTISSIKILLDIGSVNDAFALVRKYEDAIITNIYVDLSLDKEHKNVIEHLISDDDFVFNKLFDNEINKWVYESDRHDLKASEFKIAGFEKVKDLNAIFKLSMEKTTNNVTELAKFTLRQFCNNNVHYNALKYFLYNYKDDINMTDVRVKLLDKIYQSLINIFVVHFSYMLVINPEYYNSSDYVDSLDCGHTPIEGSQYWVAPVIQNLYDKYIKHKDELNRYLKNCNWLEIE